MLRRPLLAASRAPALRRAASSAPVAAAVARRFVAGDSLADAVDVARRLTGQGLAVSVDRLGEDVATPEDADGTRRAYLALLDAVDELGLAGGVEVSVKLSSLGLGLGLGDGQARALDHAAAVCARAQRAGTTVTVDAEDHTTVDAALEVVSVLRADYPGTGAVVQAYLRRTEGDCRDLAGPGSRVRLCKGAYDEPASVAYRSRGDVDRAYVRCLALLMSGRGYPMVATHDQRLLDVAGALAVRYGRAPGDFEYQMLYGVRPVEQHRLAAGGERVRVYVPYGDDWYRYLVRRLAEKPANLRLLLRALTSRS